MPEKESKKSKKSKVGLAVNIISWVLILALLAMVLYMFIGLTVAKKNKKPFYFFGYTFNVVVTDSMVPEIKVGDMVICKKAKFESIHAAPIIYKEGELNENGTPVYDKEASYKDRGDYIIFSCTTDRWVTVDGKTVNIKGQPIIHQAIGKETDEETGEVGIITRGINTHNQDSARVTAENFIGIMVTKSTFLGNVATFFQNTVNVVLLIVGIVVLIAAYYIIKVIIKKKKNKAALSSPEGSVAMETAENNSDISEILEDENIQLTDVFENAEEEKNSENNSEE